MASLYQMAYSHNVIAKRMRPAMMLWDSLGGVILLVNLCITLTDTFRQCIWGCFDS